MAMLPAQAPAAERPVHETRLQRAGSLPGRLAGRSDERLVAIATDGDARAFEVLYERHGPAILRYCRSLLRSTQEAEDVKQEVFVLAMSAVRRGAEPDAFRPWLYRVAHNACMSHLRTRRPVLVADDGILVGPAAAAEPVDGHREELRQLLDDIGRLPDVQRGALLLREMDGFSYEQVGEVLGLPLSTVRASIFRARRTLHGMAEARDADCEAIQSELADLADRRGRRGRHITSHLSVCSGCRDFRDGLRRRPAVLGGVAPTGPAGALLAVKGKLFGGAAAAGGGAAAATAGGGAGVVKIAAVAASSIALIAGASVEAGRAIDAGASRPAATHRAAASVAHQRRTPSRATGATPAASAARPGGAVAATATRGGAGAHVVASRPAGGHARARAHARGKQRGATPTVHADGAPRAPQAAGTTVAQEQPAAPAPSDERSRRDDGPARPAGDGRGRDGHSPARRAEEHGSRPAGADRRHRSDRAQEPRDDEARDTGAAGSDTPSRPGGTSGATGSSGGPAPAPSPTDPPAPDSPGAGDASAGSGTSGAPAPAPSPPPPAPSDPAPAPDPEPDAAPDPPSGDADATALTPADPVVTAPPGA